MMSGLSLACFHTLKIPLHVIPVEFNIPLAFYMSNIGLMMELSLELLFPLYAKCVSSEMHLKR